MKLIKINTDHYFIVDDSEIKEGDYSFYPPFGIGKNIIIDEELCFYIESKNNKGSFTQRTYQTLDKNKKIIRSTEPLNDNPHYADYGIITLREVKELIGEVDVIKRKDEYLKKVKEEVKDYEQHDRIYILGTSDLAFTEGYNQALEDNKEKKYTEEDILDAWELGAAVGLPLTKDKKEKLFQSLQPKTEWEVKFDENGKLKLV